jgi:hypothetical protein
MIVTEKKVVKIDRECKTSPVFISWINQLGGREYWLFYKVQTIGISVSENGDFEKTIDDLETARGQISVFSKTATPQIIVGGLVSVEDIEGIKSLLYSVNAEILTNPTTWETDGPKWKTINPLPGSFKLYDTNQVRNTIEITIELPYIFNQTT